MKTLNSKNISVLKDDNGNHVGFIGVAKVYDKNIYVDTRDGTGYNDILKHLDPLVYKLAVKYSFGNNNVDDTRHDIIVHILEGIPKYNPNKNMKLSSFIEMRVDRRLINNLRDRNRDSKNATFLNIVNYNMYCKCGFAFNKLINNEESYVSCPNCERKISCNNKKNNISVFEISESMLELSNDATESNFSIGEFKTSHGSFLDNIVKNKDVEKWLEDEDPRVIKIIELICLHDYSISAAAKQVGMTGAGANLKLRSLKRKKIVRDLFDR